MTKTKADFLAAYAAKVKPPEDPKVKTHAYKIKVDRGGAMAPITMAEDGTVPDTYQGMSLVADGERKGAGGIGWNNGRLRIETHPDLRIHGKGTRATNSEYWQLRLMPQCQQVIQVLLNIIGSAPWRIEEPELPEWLADSEGAAAAHARQWAWCRAMWSSWTAAGLRYNFRSLVEQALSVGLGFGNYLGAGRMVACKVPGLEGLRIPTLPELRAPWTITEWIFDGETPLGCVQEIHDSDSWGRTGAQGKMRVAIPYAQCMHFVHRPLGPTDMEGTSLYRPAYTLLKILERAYQMQGLSIECDSVGIREVTQDKDRPFTKTGVGGGKGELEETRDFLEGYTGEQLPWMVTAPGGKLHLHTGIVADLTSQIQIIEMQVMMAMGNAGQIIAAYGNGSRAAKSEAERSARDQIDFYATSLADSVTAYIANAMRAEFAADFAQGWNFIPSVVYGQVEERDNKVYLETIKVYLEMRDRLPGSQRSKMDEMLDFTDTDTMESEDQKAKEEKAEPSNGPSVDDAAGEQ